MAYTYTGTPNSKIEAARARITNDSAVAETALSSYMAIANAEQANVAAAAEAPAIEEPKQEVSGIQRLGETFGDILKNIFVGTQKAIEGLIDFGASTVGVFAGWAGNDELKQNATSFVAKDLTNNWYDHLNADYGIDLSFSNSFINDMSSTGQNIIRGIGQGIGQMLPMVLTGGAGAALKTAGKIGSVGLKAIKAANLVGLGMSAAGTGTEEALNSEVLDENGNKKEVTLDRAFLYGLASGAVEVATETLVGGVYDKAFGKGVADKLISKLAKSPKFGKAVKLALNSLGEGVEEVTSAAVSDTLKTIYNSADGKVHWESPDVQEMFESGVIGTLTAATLGGANIVVRKASNTATVQDTVIELEESERKADALEEKGKLTPEVAAQMEQQTQDNLAYLSKRFTQAKEKTQAKMLQQNPALSKYLNADGTVRTTALAEGVTEITAEQAHSGTMSASLVTRRNEVANTLASHGTTLAVELDETQTTNKNKLQSILRLSGKNTGAPLKLVVSETMTGENAFVTGDYMVISKDRLSSAKTVAEDLAHETTHFAEGTKEYGDLVDYLYNSLNARQGVREFKLSDGGTMKANTLWQQAVMEVYENSTAGGREGGYKISTETFEKLKEGKLSADEMSDEERLAVSEVVAKASEYVLGEETVINDLVEKNRSLAKKVLTRVKNTIATIEAAFKGDKETLETLQNLRKAEKLYEKALAASGEKFLRGRATANVLRRQVDSPVNLEYSKRGYQKQDISTVTEKSFSHHAWATNELTGCLAAAEIRAFNDATGQIKAGTFTPPKTTNGHYILEVGTYKGGERTTIIITDGIHTGPSIDAVYKIYADSAETITTVKGFIYERVTATNDYSSVEEAFRAYADTNEDTGFREYTLGSGSSFEDFDQQRREGRSNKRSSIREQTRNRYSDRVRTNAVDDTQRSLRDSEGRTLSPAQREFFKNSQARDKAGNLLVVYHGTVNEFYAFDRQYAEAEGDWGKGFYFTSTPSDVATNYASEDGADLTNKIARFAENLENQTEYEDLSYEERLKIAKKHFVKGKARTIESYLNVENPARVGENETFLDYNENYDEETGEYADEEPTGLLVDFVEALQNNVDNFESWGSINFWNIIGDLDYYEGVSLSNVAEKLKESVLDTLTTDDGSLAINELIRLALQDMGFDGIIDTTVSKKFRNMKGKTPDTKHIIVFESNQAKLVDNAEPTSNEDILYSLREKEDLDLLFDKEFFDQFKYEDKTIITETLDELEQRKASPDWEKLSWDEAYGINAKIRALKGGFKSQYDMVVAERKKLLLDEYTWSKKTGRESLASKTIQEKRMRFEKDKKLSADKRSASMLQNSQFEVIQDSNPMFDDQHVGIRSPKDIKTFAEVIDDEESFIWGDFSREDAKKALKEGSITVYSSYPIRQGVFVSTSYEQALQYAGGERSGVHSRKVRLYHVAWINGDEGQYANVGPQNYQSSLRSDSKGKTLTAEQVAFFGDSKITDSEGRLLVCYHGTSEDFTVFDKKKANANGTLAYGDGFYFSTNETAVKYKVYGDKYKQVYLNITNPYRCAPSDVYKLKTSELQAQGYDGVVVDFSNDKYIVAFEPSQIKNTTNVKPTSNKDIRYSLRTAVEEERVYSREDIETLLGDVLLGDNDVFKGIGKLASVSGHKGDIIEFMWKKLQKTNGGNRTSAIASVVNYIVDRVWLQEYYTAGDARNGHTVLNAVREYLGKVNFTEVKSALASREDYKQISSRWANSKSGTVTAAEFVEQVKAAGIRLTSTDTAAALVEINDLYNEAQAAIEAAKKSSGKSLHQTFTEDELKNVKAELTEKLTAALEAGGKPTELSKLMKYYGKVTGELRSALKESKVYNKALNKAIDLAEKLKPNSEKHFRDASHLDDPTFTAVIGQLGKLKYRSDLRKAGARKIFANFGTWYNPANLLLNDNLTVEEARAQLTETGTCGYLNADILQAIEDLTDAVGEKGPLTLEELQKATLIMQAAQAILKGYDMEYLGGEQVRLSEVSAAANATATKFAPMHKKGSWLKQLVRGYGYNIIEPRVVLAEMFGYEDNALTKAYKDITDGETQSMLVRITLLQKLDTFFKENKSYKKRLYKDTVTVADHELTVNTALQLYMLSQQQASVSGLMYGGWGIRDKKGYWVDCGKLTEDHIAELTDALSDLDVEFLKMARSFYDASGQYMYDTDLKLKGYSTIQLESSDYCPINRYSGDFARTVDESFSLAMMNASVQNLGVTKKRIHNQRKIEVQPIIDVMEAHAKSIGLYAGLAVPVKAFQRIYNCNLGTTNQVSSIRNTINEKSWKDFNKYITNLLADIQGISGKTSLGDKIVNKLRGAFATYQMGFNIKSFFSQAAGYPMAFCYLSTSSMIKAFGHGFSVKGADGKVFKNMDKYCPWAMARHHESGYALAESVEDKLSKFQNVTTQHIRYGDRLITGLLWNACQCEVEKTKGLKYGTVENMEAAGKLLEEVGRGSQGNYVASERSAMQRSSSIIKTFTMFTADNVKQLSRLVEAIGKERALTFREKKLHEVVTKAEKMAAHKYTAKTVTAVLMSNLVYVLMAQLVKHLMDKDRKDKDGNEISVFEDASITYISNLAGMFPILSEVYGVFVQGYDSDNFVYEALNGLVSASRDVYDGATLLASGDAYETKDLARPLRSLVYAVGQVLGIPTRNVYNLFFGTIKRFDESAAYEINSIFAGSAAYSKDLNKALTEGDTELSSTIIGLMLKEDGMTSTSPKVNSRLRELYEQGYKVLPRTVGESISYDGEIYDLSERQQNAFKKVYSDANADVEKLISSTSFLSLNDGVQANAIKWIYDYYYEAAVFQTVGVEPDTKRQLFAETMDVNKFAMITAACNAVEGRKDRAGNTITGSKKAAVLQLLNKLSLTRSEKLIILAYLGYDVSEYASALKAYASKLGLSKAQQAAFIKFCSI